MTHYVCTGECGGVSETPKNCGTESCSMHDKPLVACDCEDGQHAAVKAKQQSTSEGEEE